MKQTFREVNPEAAEMWAYDLNISDLTPDNVASGSMRKAFFRCTANPNHIFEKKICNMTSHRNGRNTGCIYCGPNAKIAFPGETDFLTRCLPAREAWDYEENKELNPENLLPKSNKHAYFKCENNHRTYRVIHDFYRSPQCPECKKATTKLIFNHPETKQFWREEKNSNIDINEVIQTSSENVFLKCPECAYEWKTLIALWHKKPYCQCCGYNGTPGSKEKNKHLLENYSFQTFRFINPTDAAMWCEKENGENTPDNLAVRSNYVASFCCEKGHKFQSAIYIMTTDDGKPRGCPYCNHRINEAYPGENDLFTLCKPAEEMWDWNKNSSLNPTRITIGSGKTAHFICAEKHEFTMKVQEFVKHPVCSICNRQANHSIAMVRPEMLYFWNYDKNEISPYDISPYSQTEVWWKCSKCGYEWKQKPCNRVGTKNNCPSCDLNRVFTNNNTQNTFRTMNPEASKQWIESENHGITPDNTAYKSGKTVHMQCINNPKHTYSLKVVNIPSAAPYGCPYCCTNARIAFPGETDIFTTLKNAKGMWDWDKNTDIDPYHIVSESTKKYWWKCKEGHSFHRSVSYFKEISTCPECNKRKRSVATFPHLVAQWDWAENQEFDINLISAVSSETAHWRCKKCGYQWTAQISSRKASKGLCPCCEVRIEVVKGITDLFTLAPSLKEDYDYSKNKNIDSDSLSITSLKDLWWKCHECGYEWAASPTGRTIASKDGIYKVRRCPVCAGIRRRLSYGEEYPDLIDRFDREKNEFSLEEVSGYLSREPIYWICDKCGNGFKSPVSAMIRSYNTAAHGCPFCDRKVIPREDSFAYLYPELMEEYAPDNESDAYTYTPNAQKKVSWICKNNPNHRWTSSFSKRKGAYGGCPECDQTERILLRDARPDLREFFDSKKNIVSFDELTFRSSRVVSWKCREGHSFDSEVFNESLKESLFCPICNNKKLLKGYNDFAFRYPEYIPYFDSEKNELLPDEIRYNSHIPVWWTCEHKHSYQQIIPLRVQNKECSVCARKILQKGVNDLLHTYPDIIDIWGPDNERSPNEYTDKTTAELDFLCSKGHHYKTYGHMVRKYGTECLVCSDVIFQSGVNSFADKHPELLPEWSSNNERPMSDFIPTSAYAALWCCQTCHGEYTEQIKNREYGDDSCPFCSNRRVLAGFNSLDIVKPELVPEWSDNNERPMSDFIATSTYAVLWCCQTCHGEYTEQIKNREYGDDSCPFCSNRRVLAGFNSLDVVKPELVPEWSDKNERPMSDFITTTAYAALWCCQTCHGEYYAAIRNRKYGDDSCPFCGNRRVLAGFNSLDVVKPELIPEWSDNNERPMSDFIATSTYAALWYCQICHGEYTEQIKNREYGDDSCPYCSGKKVLPGFNSFKIRHPDLIEEWDWINNYLLADPDEIRENYSQNVWWTCDKGSKIHKYLMTPKRRVYLQMRHMSACPICKGRRRKMRHYI